MYEIALTVFVLFCRQPNVVNVAVRKQFQRLLEFITEGKLHSVSGQINHILIKLEIEGAFSLLKGSSNHLHNGVFLLQAVPAYIEKVNWGSLAESLEVYSLLDQIADARQDFPVEVSQSVSESVSQSVRQSTCRLM